MNAGGHLATEVPMQQQPVSHPLLATERSDGTFLRIAFLCALTAHVGILLLPWQKDPYVPEPPTASRAIVLVPTDIKPPKPLERTVVEVTRTERRIPLPMEDPSDEMLQPVDEDIVLDRPVLYDGEIDEPFLEDPEPPAPGIHDSWERDLELPVRLAGADDPQYPQLGVVSRTGGVVILQAVVDEDGRVVDLQVLRAPVPDVGFSRAALEAVAAWRYRPGTVNGRPVAVRMSVRVEFSLQ